MLKSPAFLLVYHHAIDEPPVCRLCDQNHLTQEYPVGDVSGCMLTNHSTKNIQTVGVFRLMALDGFSDRFEVEYAVTADFENLCTLIGASVENVFALCQDNTSLAAELYVVFERLVAEQSGPDVDSVVH